MITDNTAIALQQLQGIPYSYDRTPPGINCFDLAQAVRSTFNALPLPNFDNELVVYPTEKQLPSDRVLHLLQEYCLPVVDTSASHLMLVALRFRGTIALGSVVEHSGGKYVVFMSPQGSRVEAIGRMSAFIDSLWWFAGL